MDSLLNILKSAAPALATAVAGPAGGMAVKLIADKLGIEDSTVEGVTAALTANPDLQLKLREIDLKELEVHAKDRDSARQREMAIATSQAAPYINKVIAPYLAITVTALTFGLFAMIIFVDVKPEAKDILIYILGALTASLTQILNYYFGSSAGSKDKDEKIKGLMK